MEDAADLLYLAARSPQLVGEVYFATHDEHLSVAEIAQEVVRTFGCGRILHVDWPEERQRTAKREVGSCRRASGKARHVQGVSLARRQSISGACS